MKNFTLIESNDGAMIVCEAIRSLRDIAQSCEEQRTRRYETSQKCRLAAKIIDNNTEILKHVIGTSHEERIRLLDDLDKIFERPSIDGEAVKLAERLLNYLENTNAVAALRFSPQMPMLW